MREAAKSFLGKDVPKSGGEEREPYPPKPFSSPWASRPLHKLQRYLIKIKRITSYYRQ